MNPLSWPVVLGTLVVGSPALWAAQVDGTLSTDVALVRLLLCLLGAWAACSLVAALASGAVASNAEAEMQRPAGVASEEDRSGGRG